MPHVVLYDGDFDGLLVIIEAQTGVTYQQQCDSTCCDQRTTEGFLIPVGGPAEAQKFYDWFVSSFGGSGHPHTWTEETVQQLSTLVQEVRCWHGNKPHLLQLDVTRMKECVEAWIPVITSYGRGILTLNNSD